MATSPHPPSDGPFAHSPNARGEWHDLREHLESVARLARKFAEPFGAGEWAYLAGMWHDVGKSSRAFQQYLQSASTDSCHAAELRGTVDHTSAGAQHAVTTLGVLGHLLAFVIAGHHAGLLDAISEGACLDARLRKPVEPWQRKPSSLQHISVPQLPPFLQKRLADRAADPQGVAFSFAFFVRMLFSCLVDADFLDTEVFWDRAQAALRPEWPPDILSRMEDALDRFASRLPREENPVDRHRCSVRDACLAAAEEQPGFFSLTVPTGGGKTLSSLAFALRHACVHGLERIIYVIPFTSIIEQNADVFRHVFGPLQEAGCPDPVVEHHSALDVGEETATSRLAAENWDAPLIATTSVQFYESLFSDRASRCRKLHNISKSVIILDEAQKLPVDFLAPCLLALRELASHYGATVVLCTATQPAIHLRDDFPVGLRGVREIVDEPKRLYRSLKRVEVRDLGVLSDEDLATRLGTEEQVLCVVNTRRHAQELFSRLSASNGAIHLSAAMCPEHRSEVIGKVRTLLERREVCRVVSTQLVEAGVDLDFPIVYRSLAGLDSVAQAAGRCNRNGRLRLGTTFVFRSQHERSEAFLRDMANVTSQLLGTGGHPPLYEDLLSLDAIEHYFRVYYWDQQQRWDARRILGCFKLQNNKDLPFLFAFRTAAEAFRLIDDIGRPVIVPWGEKGRELCEELCRPGKTPNRMLLRALQRYTVQVPARLWQAELGRAFQLVHDQFAVLSYPEIYYDERLGLVLDRQDLSPEALIT